MFTFSIAKNKLSNIAIIAVCILYSLLSVNDRNNDVIYVGTAIIQYLVFMLHGGAADSNILKAHNDV